MFINSRCPNCGSTVPFDNTREIMFCCYCGGRLDKTSVIGGVFNQQMPVGAPAPVNNYAAGPNLIVTYQSQYSDKPFILSILQTKEAVSINPGPPVALRLNPGKQKLFFNVNGKGYVRVVNISPNAGPVRILVTSATVTQIYIQYPSAVMPQV
ncbi:MAG: hypothetical protein J5777_08375 [Clostridiales bacterium]|nr:hypothetical protein [Clostridiales bacterium]